MELRPGGIGQELYASQAQQLLDEVRPATPAEHARAQLACELLDDIRVLDEQLKQSHRRIRTAVAASNTSLTDLYGIGPILACYLIGYTGDIGRFANRDAYAAYNGTAPVERSSGGRVVHRVSQRGNRKLNHALHLAAICQIRNPGTAGRIYFERKIAEGKTRKDAIRSLKRHVSNAVYHQLLIDAGRRG
jgi:transposase